MVVIFLGSKSDLDWGKEIVENLENFGIKSRIHIASAHKTPEYLLDLLKKYESSKEPIVYICVAGRSNALGGLVDAQTRNPVINCPPESSKYNGLDIFSSLRMPSGVACATVLEPEQAALIAAKILGVGDKQLKEKILIYQDKNRKKIITSDAELQTR